MKDFTWHKKSLGTNIFILSFYATGISFFSHFIIFNLAISIFFLQFYKKNKQETPFPTFIESLDLKKKKRKDND